MRVWKVAFGLSLAANAAFAIWTYHQWAVKTAADREMDENLNRLEALTTNFEHLAVDMGQVGTGLQQAQAELAQIQTANRTVIADLDAAIADTGHLAEEFMQRAQEASDQHLRTIASNDQLEALIEEHKRRANR